MRSLESEVNVLGDVNKVRTDKHRVRGNERRSKWLWLMGQRKLTNLWANTARCSTISSDGWGIPFKICQVKNGKWKHQKGLTVSISSSPMKLEMKPVLLGRPNALMARLPRSAKAQLTQMHKLRTLTTTMTVSDLEMGIRK